MVSGRVVVIWPDHDDAGQKFAHVVGALAMEAGAAAISIVNVPEHWPEKWDLADPVPDGIDPAILNYLVASAAPWQPPQSDKASPEYHSVGRYSMSERGLFFEPFDEDEELIWLSGPFEVTAQTRDPNSSGWGLLLRWRDDDGRTHEWAMPKEALGGGREEIWRSFMREGLSITSSTKNRGLLADYLSRVKPEGRACGLSRIGWHTVGDKAVFVLPDETFGDTNRERVLWQTEASNEPFFRMRGSLDGWKAEVAQKCVGNSRLVHAVSCTFTGPLLKPAEEESGGFHYKGSSRTGKTTALLAAGSVCGGGGVTGFARTWRATANHLEGVAESHNDLLLPLDEMGQVDAREAGETAYMLGNGTGKGRASRDGSPRRSAQWRILYLSTGEISLTDKMAEIGRAPKAGQEVRLVEITADAGAGYGIFENLHGAASPGQFAEDLRAATNRHYGTAIRQYLMQLTGRYGADPSGLHELIKASRAEFLRKHLPPGASAQVRSVCRRFALVAAAGSLATAFGLTGWPNDEADHAAGVCFNAWLAQRGGAGDHEIESGIRQVIAFVEAHGSSRFEAIDSSNERIINRVGYREVDGGCWRYYVLPEMWRREVTKGFDPAQLAKAMVKRGLILPANDGKPAKQKKIRGENHKVYALAPGIVAGDEPEGTNAG